MKIFGLPLSFFFFFIHQNLYSFVDATVCCSVSGSVYQLAHHEKKKVRETRLWFRVERTGCDVVVSSSAEVVGSVERRSGGVAGPAL